MRYDDSDHWFVNLVRAVILIAIFGYSAYILRDDKFFGPYIQMVWSFVFPLSVLIGAGIVVSIAYMVFSKPNDFSDIQKNRNIENIPSVSTHYEEEEDDEFTLLIKWIGGFRPRSPPLKWDKLHVERYYQDQLYQWIKGSFPTTEVEKQLGSSRPDIVVDDLAIEVKGPTKNKDLKSIPDKLLRYPLYFDKRIIIVLFAPQVTERFYDEWKAAIKRQYPDVVLFCEYDGGLYIE